MDKTIRQILLLIKYSIYFFIFYSGVVKLIRLIHKRVFKNNVIVFYAHKLVDENESGYQFYRAIGNMTVMEFEKRIDYISKISRFLSMYEYYDFVTNKRKGISGVVLTFDDGYECLYDQVLPILQKKHIPVCVFVTTGCIDNVEMTLHDQFLSLIVNSNVDEFYLNEFPDRKFKLHSVRDKVETYNTLSSFMKTIDNNTRISLTDRLYDVLRVRKNRVLSQNRMLSWYQISEIVKTGLVVVGGHTVTHPILSRISCKQAEYEIYQSKNALEGKLDKKIDFFAYPNGRTGDYNAEVQALLKKAGYKMAFTTIESNYDNGDMFAVPRYGLNREPFFMFGLRMSGFFDLMHCKFIIQMVKHFKKGEKVSTCKAFVILLFLLFFLSGCNRRMHMESNTFQSKITKKDAVSLLNLKIYFGHQSVGENIIDGVKDISSAVDYFKPSIVMTRYPSDFSSPVFAHSGIGINENPISKCDEFRKIMENGVGDKVDIAFFKLCFVDINRETNISKLFKYYTDTISYLESKFPRVKFITVTVPLTSYSLGIKSRIKRLIGYSVQSDLDNVMRCDFNDMLMDKYAKAGVIFDLAGIESTHLDGKRETFIFKGRRYHSLAPFFTSDGGHLNEFGRKIAADQLLMLISQLAQKG